MIKTSLCQYLNEIIFVEQSFKLRFPRSIDRWVDSAAICPLTTGCYQTPHTSIPTVYAAVVVVVVCSTGPWYVLQKYNDLTLLSVLEVGDYN